MQLPPQTVQAGWRLHDSVQRAVSQVTAAKKPGGKLLSKGRLYCGMCASPAARAVRFLNDAMCTLFAVTCSHSALALTLSPFHSFSHQTCSGATGMCQTWSNLGGATICNWLSGSPCQQTTTSSIFARPRYRGRTRYWVPSAHFEPNQHNKFTFNYIINIIYSEGNLWYLGLCYHQFSPNSLANR